jgi:hypothetical protein
LLLDHRSPMSIRSLKRGAVIGVLIASSLIVSTAAAQVAHENPAPSQSASQLGAKGSAANMPGAPTTAQGPSWQELTPAQRVSLKPLASYWGTLDAAMKRKWIALAANYPTLTQAEQVKLHSRMNEWSLLTKQERARARLNFAESKKLTPDQKVATWEAYQALDPGEKKKLAASAPPKPAGAAGAVKPVAPQKLATVPLSGKNQPQAATIKAPQKVVDSNRLLPLPMTATEPAPKAE